MIRSPIGRTFLGAASLAIVATLAGCGGESQTLAAREATAHCVDTRFAVAIDLNAVDLDPVASGASAGAFRVELPSGTEVTVSFGRTVEDAEQIEEAYRANAGGTPVDDVLERDGTAVFRWAQAPTDAEAIGMRGCLQKGLA